MTNSYCCVRSSHPWLVGMMDAFSGDKMNVAALGNVVPQLHIHHIVRFRSDPAWARPGVGEVASPGLRQGGISGDDSKVAAATGQHGELGR